MQETVCIIEEVIQSNSKEKKIWEADSFLFIK